MTKLPKKWKGKHPWAIKLAQALQQWMDSHDIGGKGSGLSQLDFAGILNIPERTFRMIKNDADLTNKIQYYAAIFIATALNEADPRKVPRYEDGKPRAWTNQQYSDWFNAPANRELLSQLNFDGQTNRTKTEPVNPSLEQKMPEEKVTLIPPADMLSKMFFDSLVQSIAQRVVELLGVSGGDVAAVLASLRRLEDQIAHERGVSTVRPIIDLSAEIGLVAGELLSLLKKAAKDGDKKLFDTIYLDHGTILSDILFFCDALTRTDSKERVEEVQALQFGDEEYDNE